MFETISKFHKEFMDKYKDDDDDKQWYIHQKKHCVSKHEIPPWSRGLEKIHS